MDNSITIYADILFLVNLYVDYFILLAVKNFLHLQTKSSRILLASLAGALFSLLSLFIYITIINYILAFIFGFFICSFAFYTREKIVLLKSYICFVFLSFAFSGIVFFLSSFTANAYVIGGKPYFQISPILLFLFTVLSYLICEGYRLFRGSLSSDFNFCKIIVEQNGEEFELFAKKDTGNSLTEPFSGLPVIVAEKNSFKKITNKPNEVFRLVPFNSLGGNGLLPAFKPEKVYVKKSGKILNCYLALYNGKLSTGTYNCLVNPETLM